MHSFLLESHFEGISKRHVIALLLDTGLNYLPFLRTVVDKSLIDVTFLEVLSFRQV